jgi:hypothetical protein
LRPIPVGEWCHTRRVRHHGASTWTSPSPPSSRTSARRS